MRNGLILITGCLGLMASSAAWAETKPKTKNNQDRVNQIWEMADSRASQIMDIWFKDGEFPKCIQILKFRAEIFPDNYEIYTDLGWMQENTEHYDEALATYVRFKKQNAQNPDAPYPEAQFYFIKKLYAKVPPLLEPTLDAKPHPDSFRILAHSYERMGLLEDSKRIWTKYLSINPNDDAAKNNLTRVEKKMRGEKIPPKRKSKP